MVMKKKHSRPIIILLLQVGAKNLILMELPP